MERGIFYFVNREFQFRTSLSDSERNWYFNYTIGELCDSFIYIELEKYFRL